VAWYAITGFSIVSATLVLLILLSESAALHAQLAISVLALREARDQLETRVAERTAELQRTTAELQEREARIRRLVDANIIGIFMWDFDGRILQANDAFLQMIGYDRQDLIAGRIRCSGLTPPEWRERDAQIM